MMEGRSADLTEALMVALTEPQMVATKGIQMVYS